RDTFVSIGESLDNLFFLLSGRIQTAPVFSAYLLEYDVMGHMQTPQDTTRALKMLSDRIEKFIKNHPERRIHFTLISDHGMDFIRVKGDRFVRMSDELSKVGITPVDSLIGHDPKKELYAIPIMHTRVTYVALHTHPDLIQEVAGRVSSLASVDLAISKVKAPEKAPTGNTSPLEWTGIWADGKIAVQFGFDPTTNQYFFPAHQNYARLEIPLQGDQDLSMSDDALFALMKDRKYPDLFYRARTSIAPVGLEHPADVLVSFKPTFCSLGFSLPGADDIASAGFHGAMEELGTLGTLLTNERNVPDAVRADTVLDLFPKFKQHVRDLGASYVEGDPNASLKNL
ncbi:alkaline phosphatase family protein, partial [Bdellovibrionota bacterium FG-1]